MKKMRRLIPAIAMLLVSAVMLSTASFAWFTMNEQVTATGMTVTAQSAGNLVIHTSPLTAANQDITVDLSSTALKALKPITYTPASSTTNEGGETVSVPAKWETAGNNTVVDGLYGNVTGGTLEAVTPNENTGDYFQEYTVYIATAGAAKDGQDIYVKFNGLSGVDQAIAPAYTIAFWILPTNGSPDYTAPTSTVNYKTALANATDGVRINTAEVNVPTTDGVGVDNATGVKIVMRVYVDGGLVNPNATHNDVTRTYTAIDGADMTWGAFKTSMGANAFIVYTNPTTGVYSEVNTSTWLDTDVIGGKGYLYAIPANDQAVTLPNYYVNNQSVPTASTTFAVVFSIEDSTL